jgi:hypothetical protein
MLINRVLCEKVVLAVVLATLIPGTCALADLENGDFSSGLADWTIQVVTVDSGVATMGEEGTDWAFLKQEFTIPNLSLSLSFEYLPLFETDGQESFSVSLLDPVTFDPLIPTDADPFDSSATYYFMHYWDGFYSDNEVLTDPAYVTQTDLGGEWTRVTLDLAWLGGVGTNALLEFDFIPGFFDISYEGEIRIDNVSVAVVPAFSSLLLGVIGLGTVTALRRKCKHLVQ